MNMRFKSILAGVAGLLCIGHAWAASCEDPKTLRFSVIPDKNLEVRIAEYRPLIHVMERVLGRRVEVIPASSYGTVIEGLLAGNIDVAELGPASYAQAKSRDAGVTAFASPIQRTGPHTDSGSQYASLLVVRRDKGFDSLARLQGASVSLVDPASTSGALVPRHAMTALTGMPLERYFGRVTFAGSHDRAIQAVQKGFVDAAFIASTRLDDALRSGLVRPDELSVRWKSVPLPNDPFVYRSQLCPSVVDKIKQAFFMENSSLQDMFRRLNTEGFVPVTDEKYQEIRRIYQCPLGNAC
jgi:phosphonate transport system substrate-binding protein